MNRSGVHALVEDYIGRSREFLATDPVEALNLLMEALSSLGSDPPADLQLLILNATDECEEAIGSME